MSSVKLIDKLKDRYNILMIFIFAVFFVLFFQLARLTIVQGDYYRDISDNKRLKEISITAPRGEIRDRYGRLLAGNKPSFTVQILKDELNLKDKKERNKTVLNLSRLLEEDGVNYIDEFPIEMNVFKYKNEDSYNNENQDPEEKIIDIIINNNFLHQILNTFYVDNENFKFLTGNKAIHALQSKGIDMPIEISLADGGVVFNFEEGKDIDEWKTENKLPLKSSPEECILSLIGNDRNIIRKIIDHPISRQLTYDLLKSKGYVDDIEIQPFDLTFDEEYESQKRSLMKKYNNITMKSSAKDDFVNIVMQTSVNNLLEKVVEEKDDKGKVTETIIPGKILISKIEEKNVKCPVTYELNEEKTGLIYKFKDNSSSGSDTPINVLIELGKKTGALKETILDKKVKNIAQEVLLNNGVNPKISVSNLQYVSINNKNNWFSQFNIPKKSSAEEAFYFLRDKFEIDKKLSEYEVRPMLLILDQLNSQGYRAYQPINIAYGIKDSTVAKLEEGKMDMSGVQVSIEPIRYYPLGNTASHILGYLGKISQSNEIKKYVEENGYSPNDIIGKTGIEEKYEDQMKGKEGKKIVEVDAFGNTINTISQEDPTPGDNLYLTIDAKLQEVAEAALKKGIEAIQKGGVYESKWGNYKFGINKSKGRPYVNATSGALVATDVKTGEILALANYPDYDPNMFSTGISNSDWESLFPENEEDTLAPRPLYNVALQTAIQPGSTFKMVTAMAALEKGMDPNKTIRDMGYVDIGNKRFTCLIWKNGRGSHGNENVYNAIRDSCNYYFYTLALGKNQRTGESIGIKLDIEDITNMAKKFGLNDKTGIEIDVPAEAHGGVPDPSKKIASTKGILKRYLKENINKYVKDGVKLDDKDLEEVINEIISWVGNEELLSRTEVIKRLDKMGIDPEKRLEGEREGLADKIKYTYLNQAGWNIADTLNITIGQGQNSYTPIQMANYIATLSNGGYLHKMSVVDSIKNYDNSAVEYKREDSGHKIKLNDYENLERVKYAMRKVAVEGTAKSIFSKFPVKVAAKTGTAQKSGINPVTLDTYDDYAWFVAFAPYDDPQIAISVVIFQGGSGGYAGPIARDVIAEYLGLNEEEEQKEVLPIENELSR